MPGFRGREREAGILTFLTRFPIAPTPAERGYYDGPPRVQPTYWTGWTDRRGEDGVPSRVFLPYALPYVRPKVRPKSPSAVPSPVHPLRVLPMLERSASSPAPRRFGFLFRPARPALLLACAAAVSVGLGGLLSTPLSAASSAALLQDAPLPASPVRTEVDARWLERLNALDRQLLSEFIGYAPPAMTDDLTWHIGQKRSWDDLRGQVIFIQSWNSRQTNARGLPARLERQLANFGDDVAILHLHTPEGADEADRFVQRMRLDSPIIIDPTGAFCDELGVYRDPVNLLIDRNGTLRYAGLNARGVQQALELLIAEKYDEAKKPLERPKKQTVKAEDAGFPAVTGTVSNARDVRGQKGPEFHVEGWISPQPSDPGDKVRIIDFSAAWCGPCIQSLPHMNQLAEQFRDDVFICWITNETPQKFNDTAKQRNLTPQSFSFPVAYDTQTRMMRAVSGSAWPHALVVSSDGVVRWQGHPASLTAATLDQIVKANRKLAGEDSKRYRWTGGRNR